MADLYLLSFASAPIYSGLSLGPVSVSSDILLSPFLRVYYYPVSLPLCSASASVLHQHNINSPHLFTLQNTFKYSTQ